MIIEKDNILKCYIVWLCYKGCKFELYRSKTKKDCKRWISENEKKKI